MRVVHVAPTPFGRGGIFGGGERYPLELARALARHVDCELISFGQRRQSWTESGGLHMRILPVLMHLSGHPAHPIAPELPLALRRADLVHAHHLRSAASRLAAVTARALQRRTVVTDHGLAGDDWGGLLPRLFDRFLMVSSYSARALQAPTSRTRIIYGGADPRRFAPDPAVRREGVLFVGRITPHKGVDRLIRALPRAARLRIAGSIGHDPALPERDYPQLLRHLAVGLDVEFLTPVAEDHLPRLYRQAAVLALPSVHRTCYGRYMPIAELLGLVVLEAMASGTPVVCSRVGGLSEVVQDGITGYLVEPGNVDELRERLTEILRNPLVAARMGQNARELAIDRFTWEACALRCLKAYGELLSQRSAGSFASEKPSRVRHSNG
jgi:glycosyltransferase involved in cell wall biosynthesis